MDLEGVARELLRVPPEEFVAERTARQRNVRARDRALATAIGALRKPAPAAWVVDLLAADGSLDEAVDLGPTLREAQARADPGEIATLRKQRAAVVAALARTGAERAADAGHPVTDAVIEQVRATIEAAMSDERAGAAVRSGLLLRPLESAGFEEVDLDGAVAVPDALPFATSRPVAEPVPITAGRRGAGRRASSRPADAHPGDRRDDAGDEAGSSRTSRPSRSDDAGVAGGEAGTGRASRTSQSDAETDDAGTTAAHGRRTGRRARTDGSAPDAPAPTTADPARERRAAREAEAEARQASRGADAALDAAEEALAAAEADRDRADGERAELERALRALDDERATLVRRVDELTAERDRAETASDAAREAFTAARAQHRRTPGAAGH